MDSKSIVCWSELRLKRCQPIEKLVNHSHHFDYRPNTDNSSDKFDDKSDVLKDFYVLRVVVISQTSDVLCQLSLTTESVHTMV